MKKGYGMRILIVFLLCLGFFTTSVMAHEEHGFKHTKEVGPGISGRYCPGLTQVWAIDDNDDGVADRCVLLIFSHNTLHVKPLPLIDGVCKCP